MKHVSDSPLGPKGLIKAAESPEFCCGCYGCCCCCCCCFFLSAFCLLYVCSLFFFVGPFALDNLTSLKYVAFVICFLVPILVPGPRVLASAAAADNATFGGIGAIKLLLYIYFFLPNCCCDPKAFYVMAGTHNPPAPKRGSA